MTINKSQGQSVKYLGIDLQTSVFSHGQLYVALSRCTTARQIFVVLSSDVSTCTANIVYPESLVHGFESGPKAFRRSWEGGMEIKGSENSSMRVTKQDLKPETRSTSPFTCYCEATITKKIHYPGVIIVMYQFMNPDLGILVYTLEIESIFIRKPNRIPNFSIHRFRIQFQVTDGATVKDITAFDEQAALILGKSFDTMLDLSLQGNGQTLIQEALESIIGKRKDFELRISAYNLAHPDASITAGNIFEATDYQLEKATCIPANDI
ncbi:hypothetical protein AQUCO_01100010v1 [Aquilegia coerulea]|uniref:Replication factor A C-terminal domain-containing protein n=1 Tax=Aquilegia coerulea TaxID=218851 RepID=A0A2G5E5A8_AQUCA|nr:hypothetical protein AQUCO_01100010v1 [Aquilegia coerulea]